MRVRTVLIGLDPGGEDGVFCFVFLFSGTVKGLVHRCHVGLEGALVPLNFLYQFHPLKDMSKSLLDCGFPQQHKGKVSSALSSLFLELSMVRVFPVSYPLLS